MTPSVEFEDKTVPQAIKKACEELNIVQEKLQYHVISHGSTGIFGLVGVKKARIRVTLPPQDKTDHKSDQNKTDQNKTDRNKSDQNKSDQSMPDNKPVQAKTTRQKKSRRNHTDQNRKTQSSDNTQAVSGTEAAENIPAAADRPAPAKPDSARTEPVKPDPVKPDPITIDPEARAQSVALGLNTLERIVNFITEETDIETEISDEQIRYHIKGGNAGVLIGKRGQTLEAIQYLVEKVVNKQSEVRIRIQVDVENYLENRKERLEGMASRMAEKAKRTGKPVPIGTLNAHDRRIVHLHLKDENTVRTQSSGEGFYRKLIIYPKRGQNRKRKST